MNLYSIYHIPEIPYAYAVDEKHLLLKIKVEVEQVKSIYIHAKDRYDNNMDFISVKMEKYISNNDYDYFRKEISLPHNRFKYYFEIESYEGQKIYYNERGIFFEDPGDKHCFQFPYVGEADRYYDVKWAQEGIVYQIFPERFNNGDKTNDPKDILQWGQEVTRESFFGGDLKGIIEKLDYIKDLGVTIIYMTPIFESESNHKYNIKDYYNIDPHFGTKEDLKILVEEIHKRDMKVILDGVFNHSGKDFFAFKDLIDNGENSKYKDWYFPYSFPINLEKINYTTFACDVSNMPKLNMANKEVRDYFIGVGRYWIKQFDIDGWRLDVCDDVEHQFWKEFRHGVRSEKSDAFIIGELFHQGKNFLKGDQLDSIMNYTFRELMLDFFARRSIDANYFNHYLIKYSQSYTESISRQLLNLLDSHDTARFLTEVKEDKDIFKLATIFQLTYVGIPFVFYGNEVGVKGENDPYCRQCMIWDENKQDLELKKHYKKLINMRKQYKEFIYGTYECIYKKGFQIAYKRKYNDDEIIIMLNTEQDRKMKIMLQDGLYNDLYNEKLISIEKEVILEPMEFKILKKQ